MDFGLRIQVSLVGAIFVILAQARIQGIKPQGSGLHQNDGKMIFLSVLSPQSSVLSPQSSVLSPQSSVLSPVSPRLAGQHGRTNAPWARWRRC